MDKVLRRYSFLFLVLIIPFSGILTACGTGNPSSNAHELAMASLDQMPSDVRSAPVTVQQAYQFNIANPEVMKQIPCYCGCGAMGHTSNYSCYVSGVDSNGIVSYDTHALGCSICVDITQDTMRLMKQGKAVSEIKAYIDTTYSKYGPSNIP